VYCPGCGATRSVWEILHGNPAVAFHQNALALISPGILACYALIKFKFSKAKWIYIALLMVTVLAFTIERNTTNSMFAPF
jgi:hypothetical protein